MAWASITYPEHPSTLVAAVSTYYEQESYMDVSFMCAGLERVEAHRLVLTSVSPFMKTLLMEHCGPEPPVISLPDVSQHLLRLVLQFLYDGVMKVNQDELAEFKNILTVLGIKVPNATVVKLNERIPTKLNPSKDPFVRRPPKRPSPVAQSRSPALVAVPPPTPSKVTNVDPSDDPLNVPDYYFRPQPSQPETANATVSSATSSTATPIIEPDPMPMDDEEEEEATALEIPVSRSSVTLQTSSPTVPTVNTSRRSTRSSIKPATPQQQPPPSPEVLIKVEREDEDMNQSNSSLVNTSLLQTTLEMENPEYPQMGFTQNETEPERRESVTDISGSPNVYCCSRNGEKSSLFDNIDVNVLDTSKPFEMVCEELAESLRQTPRSQSNYDATRPKNTPLTKKQLMCLRRAFTADSTPKQESCAVLAKELGLSATNVRHWFYNERSKIKTNTTKITRKHSPYLFPNGKHLETLNKSSVKDNSPNMRRRAQFPHKGEHASNFNASNDEISNTVDSILCELPDRSNARKKLGLNRSQVKNLNKACSEDNQPSHERMRELAKQLNIPFRKVYLWFYGGEEKGGNKNCNRTRNNKSNGFSSPTEPNISEAIGRKRNLLSLKQLSILKAVFFKNSYPSIDYQKTIAKKLDLKEFQVSNWFTMVRKKMSRANLEKKSRSDRQRILLTISTKRTKKVHWQKQQQINKRLLTSGVGSFKPNNARYYFNKDQLEILLSHYSINKKPSLKCLKDLSKQLGLPHTRVCTWFNNRRHRDYIKNGNLCETPPETVCSLYSGNLDWDGYNNSKPGKHFLTENQLSRLKEEFIENGHPPKQGRERVAHELGFDEIKVCKWFSDARRKMTRAKLNVNRREHREKIVVSYRVRCGPQ